MTDNILLEWNFMSEFRIIRQNLGTFPQQVYDLSKRYQ